MASGRKPSNGGGAGHGVSSVIWRGWAPSPHRRRTPRAHRATRARCRHAGAPAPAEAHRRSAVTYQLWGSSGIDRRGHGQGPAAVVRRRLAGLHERGRPAEGREHRAGSSIVPIHGAPAAACISIQARV